MGGSQIWLDPSETLTVNEMLKAICVVSANDCCVAMAEHIAGSQEQFVVKMNERAKQLGMNDTYFKNCHGLDEDGHVTSAYANKGDTAKNIIVNKGTTNSAQIIFEKDAGSLIPKGQSTNIVTTIALPEVIEAPVHKGDKIRRSYFHIE